MKNLLLAYESDNSISNFWAIYEARKDSLKLTAPQQRIIDRLKSGSLVVNINGHHRSGGDWTWDGVPGGSIYKAYWNTIEKVLSGIKRPVSPKGFILSEYQFNLIDRISTCSTTGDRHHITIKKVRYTYANGRVLVLVPGKPREIIGSATSLSEFAIEISKHQNSL